MPHVKFVVTRTVKAEGGETYEEGKTYDLPEASCNHWVNRGAAQLVEGRATQPTEIEGIAPRRGKAKTEDT